MKSIHIYLSILMSLFFFASCEKEIVFNGQITEPLVVVNSFITPDSVVSANITLSRFFLEDSTSFKEISNAEVSVLVNGTFKEKMNYNGNGNYLGTYKPSIGDAIKLVVKVPAKKDVSSEAIITPKPEIISLDTTNNWTGKRYETQYGGYIKNGQYVYTNDTIAVVTGHQVNYTLKFKDNPSEKNYYRLVVLTKEYYISIDSLTRDTIIESENNYSFKFSDVVSDNTSNNDPLSVIDYSTPNDFNVFSDDLFNGKTYSLTFRTTDDSYNYIPAFKYKLKMLQKRTVNVYLQSITRDYYLYLKSRPVALAGSNFFSEAVQVHNNISGGIGILGSYTSGNLYTLELK